MTVDSPPVRLLQNAITHKNLSVKQGRKGKEALKKFGYLRVGNVCRSRVSQPDSYSAEDRVTQAATTGTRWVSGILTNTKRRSAQNK